MAELLRLTQVSYSYPGIGDETPALRDVSFNVMEGEFVAIIGPGGCGKSTLLSLIAGLLQPGSGEIYINGTSHKGSGEGIGYMLQTDQLIDWQNKLTRVASRDDHERLADNNYVQINEGMNSYGLITFIDTYPSGNSECIRQRAALVRSLLKEPDILLMDEPFSAHPKDIRLAVADDIWQMLRNEKKTAVLVAGDIEEAICMADRVIVLSSRPGTVVGSFELPLLGKAGKPSAVKRSPEFASCYEAINQTFSGQ